MVTATSPTSLLHPAPAGTPPTATREGPATRASGSDFTDVITTATSPEPDALPHSLLHTTPAVLTRGTYSNRADSVTTTIPDSSLRPASASSSEALNRTNDSRSNSGIYDVRIPFVWVCGGGFTSTPILIQSQHRPRTQMACVHNRAYLIAGTGELLFWNVFALPEERLTASLAPPVANLQSLNHTEFSSIPLPTCQSITAIAVNKRDVVVIDESGCIWSMPYDLPGYWRNVILPSSIPISVKQVACGSNFSLALSNCGRIWSWGSASDCLGRPSTSTVFTPELVQLPHNSIIDICCGSTHSFAIDSEGSLLGWGLNKNGCLGIGDYSQRLVPTPSAISTNFADRVKMVACGYRHTMCILSDGSLYGWGSNDCGQCAIGIPSASSPVHVDSAVFHAASISCGAFHTAVVSDKGNLYTFGFNNCGQLGVSDFVMRDVPTLVDSLSGRQVISASCGGLITIVLTFCLISFESTESRFGDGSSEVVPDDYTQSASIVDELDPICNEVASNADAVPALTAIERMSTVFRKDAPPEPVLLNARQSADCRHVKEVKRISQMYRDKLMKDCKTHATLQWKTNTILQKADQERGKKMEYQRLRDQAIEDTVKVWVHELLPDFARKRNSKKALDLLYRCGVPPRLRSVVWPRAIANTLLINTELFSVFSSRAQKIHEQILVRGQQNGASALAVGRESTIYYIEVDLPRTFPSLAFFRRGQPLHSELRNLLQTYCCYRPDVGYVQGMSYLAGNLLLYLDPYMAFTVLANLLTLPFLHAFVRMDTEAMNTQYSIHSKLLQYSLPRVYDYFSDSSIEITPQLYVLEWFMTLFSKRLNLNTAARTWDLVFITTPHAIAIHKVAIAILFCIQDRLLGESFDACMHALNMTVKEISGDELMNAAANVRVPRHISLQIEQSSAEIP